MTNHTGTSRSGDLVERLRDFVIAEDIDLAADRIEALEAEVERLRGALREISETPNAGWMIARTALGEKQ